MRKGSDIFQSFVYTLASSMIVIITMPLSDECFQRVTSLQGCQCFLRLSRLILMALLGPRALFHPCTPNVETSHVAALGSMIAYLHRECVLCGHSGPWQVAGPFQHWTSVPWGIITRQVVQCQEGFFQVGKGHGLLQLH